MFCFAICFATTIVAKFDAKLEEVRSAAIVGESIFGSASTEVSFAVELLVLGGVCIRDQSRQSVRVRGFLALEVEVHQ